MTEIDRLERAPVNEARIGSQHNPSEIENIIMTKRWPKAQCKVCGKMHLAAIRKIVDTLQGGEFEFVEPECPSREAAAEEES